jgi:hypothetical protein
MQFDVHLYTPARLVDSAAPSADTDAVVAPTRRRHRADTSWARVRRSHPIPDHIPARSADGDGAIRFRGMVRAAVTAIPDAAKENEIALSVVPAPGADLDEEAVRQICRECLAACKQPGRIGIDPD